jgi:hypothetical protein
MPREIIQQAPGLAISRSRIPVVLSWFVVPLLFTLSSPGQFPLTFSGLASSRIGAQKIVSDSLDSPEAGVHVEAFAEWKRSLIGSVYIQMSSGFLRCELHSLDQTAEDGD